MENQNENTARVFASPRESDRHEKGSAMRLIAADNHAMEEKSARLKALRMERDAVDARAAAVEAAAKKKPVRKAAAKPAAKKAAKAG